MSEQLINLDRSNTREMVRVGVGAFVLRNGQFLMQRRMGSHGEGTWSLPGGHLEFGETPEETAAREVLEETGCEVAGTSVVGLTNDVFVAERKHYITIWTLSSWAGGEPNITEPDKCTDQMWADFENLPSPLFLPMEHFKKTNYIGKVQMELARSAMKGAR